MSRIFQILFGSLFFYNYKVITKLGFLSVPLVHVTLGGGDLNTAKIDEVNVGVVWK